MKAERIQTLTGILAIVCGVLALSAGRWIMGGIIIMLAFGMFWNRGFGGINERSIYENEINSDLTIPEIYERIKFWAVTDIIPTKLHTNNIVL